MPLYYVEAVVRSDLSRALDKLDLNVLLPMPETPGLQQAGGESSSLKLKPGGDCTQPCCRRLLTRPWAHKALEP